MQQLRYQSQNIFILQKTVSHVGKIIPRSKKVVRWLVKSQSMIHTITCTISFYSGKKKVTHNGYIIMDIQDNQQTLDCIVMLGMKRMLFIVTEEHQHAKLLKDYQDESNFFQGFHNIYSQPICSVFQKIKDRKINWK